MFVVAVYRKEMIEDYYPSETLVSLHESTESALRKMESLHHKNRCEKLIEKLLYEQLKVHEKSKPRPESNYLDSKPKYDHGRKGDKFYNQVHEKEVHEWREAFEIPFYQKLQDWSREFEVVRREILDSIEKGLKDGSIWEHSQYQKYFNEIESDLEFAYRVIEVEK